MSAALAEVLARVDTPTICNAIEVSEGGRGFARFTRVTPVSANAERSFFGVARTARIRASAPPEEDAATIRARRMEYYRMMAAGPFPAVAVVEDMDEVPVGAFWGEINASVHKGFGLAGTLTNGLMRDLGDLPDYPILAGGLGPSHAFVHVTELDVPVRVLGLEVAPGDLIHADRHGALVVPEAVVPKLTGAVETLLASERLVLEPARREGFDFAAFEEAWAAFEAARV
ncbi:RraA family protein [Pseudoroseicyclus tamaricis]|uniref:RraA family protein n=1 Tax=Pseudoroseicyclus tamaricis TaxID=2705421 RepID=A0A6B2JGK2_9RHOB|nr:RraA family protein [Pseudoroseicyclus tamaricis]NDV00293.1 RraA family protein [Pseudoroseicyclus tamaricis]